MLAIGRIYYREMFYLPRTPCSLPSPSGDSPPLWKRLFNPKLIQTGGKRALPHSFCFVLFFFLPPFPPFCLCLGSNHHTSILSSPPFMCLPIVFSSLYAIHRCPLPSPVLSTCHIPRHAQAICALIPFSISCSGSLASLHLLLWISLTGVPPFCLWRLPNLDTYPIATST